MPADAVIMAFGFNPHSMPWLETHGVEVDDWGRIAATSTALPLPDQQPENLSPVAMRFAVQIWW
jgi:NADPH-dependent glutamate synthase beta subunit-like oxidoreductase